MNPNSLKNLRQGAAVKLRKCVCCGQEKPSLQFSNNPTAKSRSPNCRDCSYWLTLLRQAFGPARNMDDVRARHAEYDRKKRLRHRKTNVAGLALQNAWLNMHTAKP